MAGGRGSHLPPGAPGGPPVTPGRRKNDQNWWGQPLPRRDLLIGFLAVGAMTLVVGVYVLYTQRELEGTQAALVENQRALVAAQAVIADNERVTRTNQCDVLNRLAETKVFIRGFLRESEPDSPKDAGRFQVAETQLSEGIAALLRDIRRTPGCKLFPNLAGQDED